MWFAPVVDLHDSADEREEVGWIRGSKGQTASGCFNDTQAFWVYICQWGQETTRKVVLKRWIICTVSISIRGGLAMGRTPMGRYRSGPVESPGLICSPSPPLISMVWVCLKTDDGIYKYLTGWVDRKKQEFSLTMFAMVFVSKVLRELSTLWRKHPLPPAILSSSHTHNMFFSVSLCNSSIILLLGPAQQKCFVFLLVRLSVSGGDDLIIDLFGWTLESNFGEVILIDN